MSTNAHTIARPRVHAVVLAAGLSSRMGAINKLLHPLMGTPLVLHGVTMLCNHPDVEHVHVITGHDHTQLREVIVSVAPDVSFVFVEDYVQGMSASIKAGMKTASAHADAVFIFLGDMPGVHPQTITALRRAWHHDRDCAIAQPVFDGQPGHPVLFDASLAMEFESLGGDNGARSIVQLDPLRVRRVPVADPGCVWDADTLDRFESLPHWMTPLKT